MSVPKAHASKGSEAERTAEALFETKSIAEIREVRLHRATCPDAGIWVAAAWCPPPVRADQHCMCMRMHTRQPDSLLYQAYRACRWRSGPAGMWS